MAYGTMFLVRLVESVSDSGWEGNKRNGIALSFVPCMPVDALAGRPLLARQLPKKVILLLKSTESI